MTAALEDYLRTGGSPEVVLADESLRPRILKEYVDLLFYKDLVERHRVANPRLMRLLLRHCLGNPASLFNVHRLYQDYRSQGLSLSKNTLYSYLDYLEDSYVVFTLRVAERFRSSASYSRMTPARIPLRPNFRRPAVALCLRRLP